MYVGKQRRSFKPVFMFLAAGALIWAMVSNAVDTVEGGSPIQMALAIPLVIGTSILVLNTMVRGK